MSAKPRILFVNRMAGMVRGGGETFDLEISNELSRMGCDVTFLAGKPMFADPRPAPTDTSILPVGKINFIRSPFLPWFPWDKVRAGWRVRVWEFQQFEKKAARWIHKYADEFDVIQICELPYLVHLLNSKIEDRKSRIVIRLTAPNAHDPWGGVQAADGVIASGTSIAKVRKNVREDVRDVPNGVNLDKFSGDDNEAKQAARAFREKLGIPEGAAVLLYVARYQDFKKHDLLIKAFAEVAAGDDDVRLVLAGSGPLQPEIRRQVAAAGLERQVHMLGEVHFDELPSVYRAADIKVISSEYESFCFAAIEAMASGLPVATTDCGWVPKLIGDDVPPIEKQWAHGGDAPGRFPVEEDGKRIREVPGGLVASRIEPHSLANAIRRMIDSPDLRETCGAWNREKAIRDHGWHSSAERLLDFYHELLNA